MKKIFLLTLFLFLVSLVSLISFLLFYFMDSSPVGFATNSQNASVNLSIDSVLAISLSSSTINFGTCEISTSRGYSLLDSSLNSSGADNEDCFGGVFPSSLDLVNIGNTPANISVVFSQSGQEFFNDSSSWLAYKVLNSSVDGGCNESFSQNVFVNITNSSTPLKTCDYLGFKNGANTFSLFIKTFINASASGGGNLTLNFIAHPVN